MTATPHTLFAVTALAAILVAPSDVLRGRQLFYHDAPLADRGGDGKVLPLAAMEAAEQALAKAAAAMADFDAAISALSRAQSDLEAAKDALPGDPDNAALRQAVKDAEQAVNRAETGIVAAETTVDRAQTDATLAESEAQAVLNAAANKTVDAETQAALNAVRFDNFPDGESSQ